MGNTTVGMTKRLTEEVNEKENERREGGKCAWCRLSDYTEIRKTNLLESYQIFFIKKSWVCFTRKSEAQASPMTRIIK